MLTLLHVLIAITGLVQITWALFRPSQQQLKLAGGLLTGTITSGVALVVIDHASVLHTCISGLTYTVISLGGMVAVSRRLAYERSSN